MKTCGLDVHKDSIFVRFTMKKHTLKYKKLGIEPIT